MNWEMVSGLSAIIQAVAVIVSLFFIWKQIREQTTLTKAANVQALVELSSPFNLELIKDREMAEMWSQGRQRYEKSDQTRDADYRARYANLIIWWLMLHENIYAQHDMQLLDDVFYTPWEKDLRSFVAHQLPEEIWKGLKENYSEGFARHVDALLLHQKMGHN